MSGKIAVIGSGFAGLSAATTLASNGFEVSIYEKNGEPGGRARSFSAQGFTFDMGPSWYWMPDVFERYFQRFGKTTAGFYQLKRLDPSYRVWFSEGEPLDVPADYSRLKAMFESLEKGAGGKLDKFLAEAEYKYNTGMNELAYKPALSVLEYANKKVISGVFRLQLFNSLLSHVKKYFRDPRLIQLLEFPVLFLGAKPDQTPALYSLMNYADMKLGTWYPMGGMNKIVEGMVKVAEEYGVNFNYNTPIERIQIENGRCTGVICNNEEMLDADAIVSGADYHHVDQTLLPEKARNYDEKYWNSRVMAPSSLLYYIGVNKKLGNLIHHNLFFDKPFGQHAEEIYDRPQWPDNPLFYVCCPSKTDSTVAPAGGENLFILIPVAPGLRDTDEIQERYFKMVMERLEKLTGESITPHIVYRKHYAHRDFISDYNSFKGNAYGLANTLRQTAILKPSIKNKHLSNLYYTGQLTVPGPGVPPSLISGQVVAEELMREFK